MKTLLFVCLLFPLSALASTEDVLLQPGHARVASDVKFSPDHTLLVSYSVSDGGICLWAVASGRLLWRRETSFIQKGNEYYKLTGLAFSPDRKRIASGSANGTVQLWDTANGRLLWRTDVHKEGVGSVGFMPDGKSVVATSQRMAPQPVIRLLRIEDGASGPAIEGQSLPDVKPTSRQDTSEDGRLLAEADDLSDGAIKISDTRTGESRYIGAHPGVVKAVAYSPDGAYIAIAGSDQRIYFFNAADRSPSKTLSGHSHAVEALVFSPDGQTLVSIDDESIMKVWNWKISTLLRDIELEDRRRSNQKVEFSKDGKFLLMLRGESLTIWDARSWKPRREILTSEKFESKNGFMTIFYSSVPVQDALFIAGGKRILAAYADGTLRTWDASSGKQVRKVKIGAAASFIGLSLDEKTIVAVTGANRQSRLWRLDVLSGKAISINVDEETDFLEALAVSPDGKTFVTADILGAGRQWEFTTLRPIRELNLGGSAIAFNPDGRTLAGGGDDQNVSWFDVGAGKKLYQLIPRFEPSGLNDLEAALTRERDQERARLKELKAQRDKRAAIDTASFKTNVYIKFEHYGDMTPSGDLRLLETDAPSKSLVEKPINTATAIWLRLHNESPLPIEVPTQSMYLPNANCFHAFPGGRRILGLCEGREIALWFGLEDKAGKPIRYGFDFGSSAVLLPGKSVLFAVPRAILRNGSAIHFSYSFQNENVGDAVDDYGEPLNLRFTEAEATAGFIERLRGADGR